MHLSRLAVLIIVVFVCTASIGCKNLHSNQEITNESFSSDIDPWATSKFQRSKSGTGTGIDPRARQIEQRLGY